MKNSFLIYYDFEEQTAALTDAQVGRADADDPGL